MDKKDEITNYPIINIQVIFSPQRSSTKYNYSKYTTNAVWRDK